MKLGSRKTRFFITAIFMLLRFRKEGRGAILQPPFLRGAKSLLKSPNLSGDNGGSILGKLQNLRSIGAGRPRPYLIFLLYSYQKVCVSL